MYVQGPDLEDLAVAALDSLEDGDHTDDRSQFRGIKEDRSSSKLQGCPAHGADDDDDVTDCEDNQELQGIAKNSCLFE